MRRVVFIIFIGILSMTTGILAQEDAQQFEGFNLQGYTEGGEMAWDVNGDTADIYGSTIEIFNVDANRYGEQEVNLKAKTGILDKVTGNIHLEKDVVITSKTGGQLLTDTLDWDKEKDLVSTDDPVRITDERMTATGIGLRARPSLKTVRLNEDVTVNIRTEPKNPDSRTLTITCDGPMEIDQAKSMAIFNKNVVAIQTDRTLTADKMEVYFDPEEKQLSQVICLGNVKIFQGENKTFAEKAIYTAKDQKVVLFGRPKMIMITEGEGKIGGFNKE